MQRRSDFPLLQVALVRFTTNNQHTETLAEQPFPASQVHEPPGRCDSPSYSDFRAKNRSLIHAGQVINIDYGSRPRPRREIVSRAQLAEPHDIKFLSDRLHSPHRLLVSAVAVRIMTARIKGFSELPVEPLAWLGCYRETAGHAKLFFLQPHPLVLGPFAAHHHDFYITTSPKSTGHMERANL